MKQAFKFYALPVIMTFSTLVTMSGCDYNNKETQQSKNKSIKELVLTNVHSVIFEGEGEVLIDQSGSSERLYIQASDEDMPYISTKINQGILTIKVDTKNIPKPHGPLIFSIELKELVALKLSGSVQGSAKNIDTHKFIVDLTGSVDFALQGTAYEQNLSLNGSINYKAENLKTNFCIVSAYGSGSIVLNCSEKITGQLFGAFKLRNEGAGRVEVKKLF